MIASATIPFHVTPIAMRISSWPNFAVVAVLALMIAGCSTPTASRARAPRVAVAIRHLGAVPPTAAQLAVAHRSLHDHLIAAGYTFAEVPAAAQFVVHAEFTPSSVDPTGGHLRIVGVEPTHALKRTMAATGNDREDEELRRRLQDIERWIEAQSKTRLGESTN